MAARRGRTGAGPGAVRRRQAPLVRHSIGPDRIDEERPDGSVVVGFDVTNRDGFRSFVLSFLDHAVVLEPPELRDDIVAWLEALAPSTG